MSTDAPAVTPLAAPRVHAADLSSRDKALTLAGVLLALLLAALDQTIVATAGPLIQRDLHIPASMYAWLTTAYLVASTVLVPIYGKLSDLFGRKPILLTGILVFLLGSMLCGISGSTTMLIVSRAVQGAGSASLFTTAFAVVADLFPPAERGRYNGLFGAVFGFSSVVGPLAGGFITDHFGWHWVFFVNLPLGAVALAFIVTKMPRLGGWHHDGPRPRIDFAGAVALASCVVPLLLALSLGRPAGALGRGGYAWGSAPVLGLFALAAAGLVAFVLIERRTAAPLLDLSLFRNKVFAVGNLATFVGGMSFLASMVFLPLFMVNVVGLSATSSGLTIMPLTMGLIAGNVVAGHLTTRIGRYKALLLVSLVVLVGAYAVMGFTLRPDSSQLEVTLKMILVGIGLGPSLPIYTLAITNAVEPRQIGVATAASTFFRQMGTTIGVALLGSVFAVTLSGSMERNMGEATAGLPPALAAQLPRGREGGAGGEGEGAPAATFDAQAAREKVHARFGALRADVQKALRDGDAQAKARLLGSPTLDPRLRAALTAPELPEALRAPLAAQADAGLAAAEQQAELTVDKVAAALKQAFTDAVTGIYRWALVIAVLALLVTLPLPDLQLRRAHGPRPEAAAAH